MAVILGLSPFPAWAKETWRSFAPSRSVLDRGALATFADTIIFLWRSTLEALVSDGVFSRSLVCYEFGYGNPMLY
jgi:hypothetical protein